MIKKLKKFLDYDIRTILRKLGLYPNYFHKTGFKSIYSKIIFSLIFNQNSKKIKRKNFNLIFNNSKTDSNHLVNYLVSMPSSGSMLTRCMFKSYVELYYKVGNGIPKYDSINNQWMFSASPFIGSDLFNSIHNNLPLTIPESLYLNTDKFISSDEFNKRKIVFGRHPIGIDDLFDIKKIKPIILIRDPTDQITSNYMNYDKREIKLKSSIDYNLADQKINMYKKYINFWYNYVSKKSKEDYLIINYNDLVNSSELTFEKMLRFFNYKINPEYIKKCALIHSKEKTMELIEGIEIRKKIRFTDENTKKEQKLLLNDCLNKKLNELVIIEIYKNINKN